MAKTIVEQVCDVVASKGYDVEVFAANKNNDVKMVGLKFGKEIGVSPVIYINNMIDRGLSVEEIAREVILLYKNANESDKISTECFNSFEEARPDLRLKLVNASNKNALEEAGVPVKVIFDDLVAYPYISMRIGSGFGSVKVCESLLRTWGVTEDVVYEAALNNTLSDVSYRDIISTLADFGAEPEDTMLTIEEAMKVPMFVLTNGRMLNGASAILNKNVMKEIGNCAVIPSSVHEMLVLPNYRDSVETLEAMIQEVNTEKLSPDEVLSDHPYFFENGVYVGTKGFAISA